MMLDISQVVMLLREVGLPAAIVVWFLWRLEPRIDRLSESLERFNSTLQAHIAVQQRDHNREGG